MAVSINTSPTAVSPGDTISLDITGAIAGRIAEFAITSVPDQSAIEVGPIKDTRGRIVVPTQFTGSRLSELGITASGYVVGPRATTFTPDVAGVYGVRATVIRERAAAGSYEGDPLGEYRRIVEEFVDGSVYVGSKQKLTVAALGHSVDIQVIAVDSTVRAASLVNPTDTIARMASLDSTVLAAVAALVGVAVSALGEDIQSKTVELRDRFNGHLASVVAHAMADAVNDLTAGRAGMKISAIQELNRIRDKYVDHIQGTGGWHLNPDLFSWPVAAKARDEATATVLIADMQRVYETHRVRTSATTGQVHNNSDADNPLTAAKPLTSAIIEILKYYVNATPTTPTGENPGDLANVARYGFR